MVVAHQLQRALTRFGRGMGEEVGEQLRLPVAQLCQGRIGVAADGATGAGIEVVVERLGMADEIEVHMGR
jgi:hypothetical protein